MAFKAKSNYEISLKTVSVAKQRLFTQPLLSSRWFLACDWLALYSMWAVPTSDLNPMLIWVLAGRF
jgi:hypothetical protein